MKPISINSQSKTFGLTWVTASSLLQSGLLYVEHYTLLSELGTCKLVDGFLGKEEAKNSQPLGYGTESECNAIIRILTKIGMNVIEPQSDPNLETDFITACKLLNKEINNA